MDNLLRYLFILFALWLGGIARAQSDKIPLLSGPYLGQKPPDKVPEIFAPGIISVNGNNHSHPAFSKDGKEVFWSVYTNEYNEGNLFFSMKEENGKWTEPILSEESKIYDDGSPFYSLDGKRLYFFSDRPLTRDSKWQPQQDFNIWYLKKKRNGWSKPKIHSFLPNTLDYHEFDVCEINDGSMYLTRKRIGGDPRAFEIVKSSFSDGTYSAHRMLSQQFNDGNLKNWAPYVDPDETYIIFSSNRDNPEAGSPGCDLYISFKSGNEWSSPITMGPDINTMETIERFPYVSPDGKYFFFVRGYGDIYWVDASIIGGLKDKQIK